MTNQKTPEQGGATEEQLGASFFRAASAERRSHEGRGWTREHDLKHGPEHPLRLALDYLANGKPVKAGSLILAALDVLSVSASADPVDEHHDAEEPTNTRPQSGNLAPVWGMLEEMREGKAHGILVDGREHEYPISYFIDMLEEALNQAESEDQA